jgi:class 3 adenylate cyclase
VASGVNIAARIMASAEPGEILVTESVPASSRVRVRINERGTHQLKGLPRDWRLFALIG